jgi:hypothetical protein
MSLIRRVCRSDLFAGAKMNSKMGAVQPAAARPRSTTREGC